MYVLLCRIMEEYFGIPYTFNKTIIIRELIVYSSPDSEDSSSSRRNNFLNKHTKTLALPSLNIYCKLSTFGIQCYISIKCTILLFSQKLIKTTQLSLSQLLLVLEVLSHMRNCTSKLSTCIFTYSTIFRHR